MKFVISQTSSAVYWMEVGDIFRAPLRQDDTFDLKEGSLVEDWDDVPSGERTRILTLMAR